MVTIVIRGLEFYAHHGATDEEQTIGHRYRADVEVTIASPATQSDQLQDTLDYGLLCRTILEASTEQNFRLMERLAQEVVDRIGRLHVDIAEIHLFIGKVAPPVPHQVEVAGVRIHWKRPAYV